MHNAEVDFFKHFIELEYMSHWERLDKVIQYLGLNVNSFAKEIGLNRAERLYQIKKGNYDISKNLAGIIVDGEQISFQFELKTYK